MHVNKPLANSTSNVLVFVAQRKGIRFPKSYISMSVYIQGYHILLFVSLFQLTRPKYCVSKCIYEYNRITCKWNNAHYVTFAGNLCCIHICNKCNLRTIQYLYLHLTIFDLFYPSGNRLIFTFLDV